MSEILEEDAITALALAVGRGDRSAADPFVRRTRRDVLRYLSRLVGPAEAEDLTQETYARALGTVHRFSGRGPARGWLIAIARRVAADHFRALAARPRTVSDQDWRTAVDRAPAHRQPAPDDTVALALAVRTLSPARREAFLLTQVAGLGYAEAARRCGCPVGTIRSRVARARRDLAAVLTAWAPAPAHPRTAVPARSQ